MTSSPQLARTINALLASSRPGTDPINVDVSTSPEQSRSTHAAVLSVVPVSAARPTVPDSRDVSGVLAVVTSGTRTAWELLAIAEACLDAGCPVAGALVVLSSVDEDETEDADPEQLRLSATMVPPPGRAGRGPA